MFVCATTTLACEIRGKGTVGPCGYDTVASGQNHAVCWHR